MFQNLDIPGSVKLQFGTRLLTQMHLLQKKDEGIILLILVK